MSIPNWTIDVSNKTSTLDIYVDNVLVTIYSFNNNIFNLSALNTVNVELVELNRNINIIFEWISLINKYLNTNLSIKKNFDNSIKRKDNSVKGKLTIDNILSSDINFQQEDSYVTFKSRSNLSLDTYDFILWINFINTFYKICKNF